MINTFGVGSINDRIISSSENNKNYINNKNNNNIKNSSNPANHDLAEGAASKEELFTNKNN